MAVYNTTREHEQRELVHDRLVVPGFRGAGDGDLGKCVGSAPAQTARMPAERRY
ncbi:MAG: hypothetical protein JWN22_1773 [Nocardioides sp.]|jgi:hypothetical protein|nr:hypothetical protein [Nocardioides sp.]